MVEATSTARSYVWEPPRRLPFAGTRIAAERGARRDRAAFNVPQRIELADLLHREACRLASREAQCRLIQAELVAAFVKRRLWRPLGFVRLADYTAERLGMRARTLQEDARVVTALELLPRIRLALDAGAIRWTHARLLAGVATPTTQDKWLELALASTTRRLAELIRASRREQAEPNRSSSSENDAGLGEACARPDACASSQASAGPVTGPDACALLDDGEPADPPRLWSIVVTRPGRRLWRVVGDLASRMCGADVPASRVAEAVAAEAMSWDAWEPPATEPPPRRARRERDCGEFPDKVEKSSSPLERRPDLDSLLFRLDDADAHEIDSRLRIVRRAMQQIDAELGAALRKVFEQRVQRRFGFTDFRLYAEARLGICGSKAMALVRLDRECALRSTALLRAYREGRITWLATTALLPVISRQHEDAWITRAGRVTLRRLEADVSWALDRFDESAGRVKQAPPPLDLDVTADALSRCSTADIQMRAHPGTDLASFGRRADARIGIVVPESIATLLDDAIEGCRHAIEPQWRAFERILAHAWLTWMALPQHENPVYARDDHRCQVPGCRSRGPLHAHHVWFRSKGGPDFAWNLTTVCDAHHQAIHRGDIRVYGRAPDGLVWELGCRPGRAPLMCLRGEVYRDNETSEAGATCAKASMD